MSVVSSSTALLIARYWLGHVIHRNRAICTACKQVSLFCPLQVKPGDSTFVDTADLLSGIKSERSDPSSNNIIRQKAVAAHSSCQRAVPICFKLPSEVLLSLVRLALQQS